VGTKKSLWRSERGKLSAGTVFRSVHRKAVKKMKKGEECLLMQKNEAPKTRKLRQEGGAEK